MSFPFFVNRYFLELGTTPFSATMKDSLAPLNSCKPRQSYLLAQILGHTPHLLVGFLVHHFCHWLYLFCLHLSFLVHRGSPRVYFQVGLYLNHVLIHRYFICPLHQSGYNRKIEITLSFYSTGNFIQEVGYTVDGRAEKSK